MMIRLKDKDYKFNIDYTLNFNSIGKIEIYKEYKTKEPIYK
ncbi:hypothetical protein EV142_103357 [Flavobacterium circumlabens]|uniref:Uncharacterized protein n=1 Tax=Flavobacterium circumlabens TaxID=2133765 RepID=A0ABY2B257_9FLAO|nr:hypothetical protein EV142_103357 [Flavobacterium circumlabens]